MAERPKTQLLDLKSEDFGPDQEKAGARVSGLAKPPPTEFIEIPENVRPEAEVLEEVTSSKRTVSARAEKIARTAASLVEFTIDSARWFAGETMSALDKRPSDSVLTTLAENTPLFVRPEGEAGTIAQLSEGNQVIAFPAIDAPPGWVAIRTTNSELGWVPASAITKK